jgi:hypothetical protein
MRFDGLPDRAIRLGREKVAETLIEIYEKMVSGSS